MTRINKFKETFETLKQQAYDKAIDNQEIKGGYFEPVQDIDYPSIEQVIKNNHKAKVDNLIGNPKFTDLENAQVGMAAYREFFEEGVETADDLDYWIKVGTGECNLSDIIRNKGTFEYDSVIGMYGEDFDIDKLQNKFSEILKTMHDEVVEKYTKNSGSLNLKIYTNSKEESLQILEYFKDKSVDFQEINISEHPEAKEYLKKLGFISAPVTEYNKTQHVKGFQPQELQKFVAEIKRGNANENSTNLNTNINKERER